MKDTPEEIELYKAYKLFIEDHFYNNAYELKSDHNSPSA